MCSLNKYRTYFGHISDKNWVQKPSKAYLEMAERRVEKRSELNPRQIKALDYVRKNGKITNKEYVRINDVSRETAKRDLSELLRKKILKSFGRGRGLYYVIGS